MSYKDKNELNSGTNVYISAAGRVVTSINSELHSTNYQGPSLIDGNTHM